MSFEIVVMSRVIIYQEEVGYLDSLPAVGVNAAQLSNKSRGVQTHFVAL